MTKAKKSHSNNKGANNLINEYACSLEKAIRELNIPSSQKDTFLSWAIRSLWEKYKEERMNKRLIIENKIKNLGIRLPNGTVKKDYLFHFELPSDVSNVQLVGLNELGLTLKQDNPGVFTVSGKPNKAGDFSLKLTFNTITGEDKSTLTIPIAFNPNPRNLWKNIPTPKNIAYYKDDCAKEYIKVEAGEDGLPKKDIVAASQRGRSHAQEGKARDDHFKLFHCPDSDWYILAVADGAGSAKYSRKGSWVACDTIVEHCKSLLLNNQEFENAIVEYNSDKESQEKRTNLTRFVYDIVFKGAVKAHEAINAEADTADDATPKDFATTLMFAICKKYEFGWFIASFWVGDGAMCLYDESNQTAKLLGVPDEGEFSGQTRFLTMPEVLREKDAVSKRLRMAIVPDFTALFLMSDGVSDPMFETDKNLNDYTKWKEFYETLKNGFPEDEIGGVDLSDDNEEAKDQLLNWLDFWSPGNHDDRTIAILY
jgi:serine/threonine protein phosphatase PrpC